jgi:ABC-type transport system substrate-binding protein
MRPNTAASMPEVSDDFKTFTFRIKPGIYFADDPAFKGSSASWAEDYVYSLKRHYDPRWKSANLYILENAKILGLSELRKKLMAEKKPFDYDTPVEGLRALDRYTFQIKLGESTPRLLYNFADGSFTGALAREVVEFYGDKIGEHPVGTGPSAERLEAQFAHRAGAQPELPRGVLRRERHRPMTRACRLWPRATRASACRCWTKCTSPSSKNRSRAG